MSLVLRELCLIKIYVSEVHYRKRRLNIIYNKFLSAIFLLTLVIECHILINTYRFPLKEKMSMSNFPEQAKKEQLNKHGCLNPHPEAVSDELFSSDPFFDPHDLLQVKYEMLRRVQKDKLPASHAAENFGFSRVSFYQVQAAFKKKGLRGLLPRKRGPKDRHKLSEEVMSFINDIRKHEEGVRPDTLTKRIKQHFEIKVHPRSIQRALAAQKKKI